MLLPHPAGSDADGGADMARVESLRPIAEAIAREFDRDIKLVRFEIRTELEVIQPKGGDSSESTDG